MSAFEQHQPPQGPRGKAWLMYNQKLHSALDKFWGTMKAAMKIEMSHKILTPDEEGEFNGICSFGSSKEHVEAVRAEENAILAELDRQEKKLATPVSVFTDSPTAPPLNRAATNTRKKNKTQPENSQDDTSGLEAALSNLSLATTPIEPPLEPIPVSRRNFDEVFGAMFPADRAEAKRPVDWGTFSHGMRAVGCALENSSGGSEVLFRHVVFGKITFHKPHPEPKIDPIKLHAWGDRLEKRFGWRRERFVVVAAAEESGGDEVGGDAM